MLVVDCDLGPHGVQVETDNGSEGKAGAGLLSDSCRDAWKSAPAVFQNCSPPVVVRPLFFSRLDAGGQSTYLGCISRMDR